LVDEAGARLLHETSLAEGALGGDHATTIGFYLQLAQAAYKRHFFGRKGYRSTLIASIKILGGLFRQSTTVLGDDHPLTRKIVASFLQCFDEQLDWSLDDIPGTYLEYRAYCILKAEMTKKRQAKMPL